MKIDEFARHEALDRTSLAAALIEDWLCGHVAVATDPEMRQLANTSCDLLWELYQRSANDDETLVAQSSAETGG